MVLIALSREEIVPLCWVEHWSSQSTGVLDVMLAPNGAISCSLVSIILHSKEPNSTRCDPVDANNMDLDQKVNENSWYKAVVSNGTKMRHTEIDIGLECHWTIAGMIIVVTVILQWKTTTSFFYENSD